MPVILLLVGAFVLYLVLRGRDEDKPRPPPGEAIVPARQGSSAPAGGRGGDLAQQAARFLAEQVGTALKHEESRTVLAAGWSIAAGLILVNVVAAAIVAIATLFIVGFIELAYVIDEVTHDRTAEGLAWFESTWSSVYNKTKDSLSMHAQAQTGGVLSNGDLAEIELAAKAYADGFTHRLNYLRATAGWSGLYTDIPGVFAAWNAGAYGGRVRPQLSEAGAKSWGAYFAAKGHAMPPIPMIPLAGDTPSPYCDYINRLYWEGGADGQPLFFDGMDGGIYGTMMYDIFPPNAKVYRPSYWTPRSGNVDHPSSSAVVSYWGLRGEHQANAGMFLSSYAQGVPLGSSRTAALSMWRKRGMFQGVILPDTYPGYGVRLADVDCYTPDNGLTVRFMTAPAVNAAPVTERRGLIA